MFYIIILFFHNGLFSDMNRSSRCKLATCPKSNLGIYRNRCFGIHIFFNLIFNCLLRGVFELLMIILMVIRASFLDSER
jgi:hypothetical protein